MGAVKYKFHLSGETFQRVTHYQHALISNQHTPGSHLARLLAGKEVSRLSTEEFLACLIRTKKPKIYAESQVRGDGLDWNREELSILGDVGVSMPVTVFDDGKWQNPQVHEEPFAAHLLFVPGALLSGGQGSTPPDWEVVSDKGKINYHAYYKLYERRLLPLFLHANQTASIENKPALITLPGIGCGYFAGDFKSKLKPTLEKVLVEFLRKHIARFPNIQAVYFDPHSDHENNRFQFEHLTFLVRPLLAGNEDKPQLCPPQVYSEGEDDFSGCRLYSVVAWDHVSWPGNDFYRDSRHSDDGVKAAATDSMAVMTGVEGAYSQQEYRYKPPAGYRNWEEVVLQNDIQLQVKDNLTVVPLLPGRG